MDGTERQRHPRPTSRTAILAYREAGGVGEPVWSTSRKRTNSRKGSHLLASFLVATRRNENERSWFEALEPVAKAAKRLRMAIDGLNARQREALWTHSGARRLAADATKHEKFLQLLKVVEESADELAGKKLQSVDPGLIDQVGEGLDSLFLHQAVPVGLAPLEKIRSHLLAHSKVRTLLRDHVICRLSDVFLRHLDPITFDLPERYSLQHPEWWSLKKSARKEAEHSLRGLTARPGRNQLRCEWSKRAKFIELSFEVGDIVVYDRGVSTQRLSGNTLSKVLKNEEETFEALPVWFHRKWRPFVWPKWTLSEEIESLRFYLGELTDIGEDSFDVEWVNPTDEFEDSSVSRGREISEIKDAIAKLEAISRTVSARH